jgi:DNA mismatch endonuclease, patch repair protein
MPDVFTKAKRSAVMSRIRGAGNKGTELRLIILMRAAGITGWRRGVKLRFAPECLRTDASRRTTLGGRRATPVSKSSVLSVSAVVQFRTITIRPDFVFPQQRLAVFVDGCFWHGCPRHATWPKNRAAFWLAKLSGNKSRDRLHNRLLREHGWRVLRIWEHALAPRLAARTMARLQRFVLARNRD